MFPQKCGIFLGGKLVGSLGILRRRRIRGPVPLELTLPGHNIVEESLGPMAASLCLESEMYSWGRLLVTLATLALPLLLFLLEIPASLPHMLRLLSD